MVYSNRKGNFIFVCLRKIDNFNKQNQLETLYKVYIYYSEFKNNSNHNNWLNGLNTFCKSGCRSP